MNSEIKRLAIIATVLFFPTAIAGWLVYKKSAELALKFFRSSIYIFVLSFCALGFYAVTEGSRIVEPLGTFF